MTDFNKIIICINSKQIQTNNEKGQKALGRRKKSNRLNDMCRVTAWKLSNVNGTTFSRSNNSEFPHKINNSENM